MQNRLYFLLAILMVAAAAAFGQTFGASMTSSNFSSGPDGSFRGRATFSVASPYLPAAMAGAPYSGDEITETVQTLADGGHITRIIPGSHVCRDAEGRTRVERPLIPLPIGMGSASSPADIPTLTEILDPIAGYRYVLDAVNRVAHRIALQALRGPVSGVASVARAAPVASMPEAPQSTLESLGSQVIDGVTAEGTRTTTTIPVGTQGNDRPLAISAETWTSVDLKIAVRRVTSNPISGVQTFRIDNLSRATPDPSLFMPPAGYAVVDETGMFTISFGQ